MLRLWRRGRFLGKFVSHLVWTEIADIPPGLGRAGVGVTSRGKRRRLQTNTGSDLGIIFHFIIRQVF